MTKYQYFTLSILILLTFKNVAFSQFFDPEKGCLVEEQDGPCLPNPILSAVPFLRIVPDARAGGMGNSGVATSADPNAMHFNASKLAFVQNNFSISGTYTPWLSNLGLQDVFLAYLSGYKQINPIQTIGFGFRYFSLGEIDFTTVNGNPAGSGFPREMELSFAYARKLSDKFSAGFTAKYIHSNLASGQNIGVNAHIESGNGVAADLSLSYVIPMKLGNNNSDLSFGLAVTNLGSKITYLNSTDKDFLPSNLGLGAAWNISVDDYNSITFAADVNKLIIPTPISYKDEERYDRDNNGKADFKEYGIFEGAYRSFYDASGRLNEELAEIYYSVGAEYWYDEQFSIRAGYFYESPRKGDRQFITTGLGIRYNVFGMNISYLISTNGRKGPLDNTLRFTFMYDLGRIKV